jgi:hypothetical protein
MSQKKKDSTKLPLPTPDSHHLSAAVGWLELGDPVEAGKELARLDERWRAHPVVLSVQWQVYAKTGEWEAAWAIGKTMIQHTPELAESWINAAYAARRATSGGLQFAYEALLPAAQLPLKEPVVLFNLACYSCQLGNLVKAKDWLRRAFRAGDSKLLKSMALAERDLEPLWKWVDESA